MLVNAVVSHEGEDRPDLSLPVAHDAAVVAASAANPRTVVVARCPGACFMPWLESVPAVLAQFVGGQVGGTLCGVVICPVSLLNASARLDRRVEGLSPVLTFYCIHVVAYRRQAMRSLMYSLVQ